MSPRFDPRWLVIPTLALMIALGIPRQVPITVSSRLQPIPARLTEPTTAGPSGSPEADAVLASAAPTGITTDDSVPDGPASDDSTADRSTADNSGAGGDSGTAGSGRDTADPTDGRRSETTATAGRPPPTREAGSGQEPRWRPPLDGPLTISRAFRPPAHPYGAGHRGVDLAGTADAAVRAVGDGVVGFAGWVGDRSVVSVTHGELRTTYEPLVPAVRAGQRVVGGDVLGHLVPGHPGCPATACLHWGLLRGTAYLDPLGLLRRVSPRLLPLAP